MTESPIDPRVLKASASSDNKMALLRLYDNSRIEDFRRCNRYFYYRHNRDWAPEIKGIALSFGTAYHAAMDVIWRGYATTGKAEVNALLDKAYEAFLTAWQADGRPHPDQMTMDDLDYMAPRTPQIAQEMFWEYWDARQYIFKDPSFELIDVERPFAVSLDPNDDSLFYVGRLDKIFGFRGKVIILDHKCLGEGTPVLKFDGSVVPVEQIKKGDTLIGPDSAPRTVKSVCTGVQNLYRVVPVKGDPYIVNEAHILSLKMTGSRSNTSFKVGGRKVRAQETVNVSLKDYLSAAKGFRAQAKGWRVGVDFEPKPLHPHLPPYMLGIWLGDGSSCEPAITAIEPEIVQEIHDYAIYRDLYVRKYVSKKNVNSVTWKITKGPSNKMGKNNVMLDALRSFNLIGNKHIPLSYKTADYQSRRELLAGIIDTDGSLQPNGGGGYRISQKNDVLAQDICFLARSLGLAAYLKKKPGVCMNNGKVGMYNYIHISGNCWKIPVRVARKKTPQRKCVRDVLVTGIKDVESVGPGRYYGFELDGPDHLFLLGDFTVTHNTTSSYKKDGPFRADFSDSFSLSSQVDGYLFYGHTTYKEKFGGVWIDAGLVHKTVHDGFMFIPIEKKIDHLDAWLWETHQWIDQIEGNLSVVAERSAIPGVDYLAAFPRNVSSCSNFGGCRYADICRAVVNPGLLEEPPLGFKIEHWSPFSEIKLEELGFTVDRTGERPVSPDNMPGTQPTES